jgi:hypothetical protein
VVWGHFLGFGESEFRELLEEKGWVNVRLMCSAIICLRVPTETTFADCALALTVTLFDPYIN